MDWLRQTFGYSKKVQDDNDTKQPPVPKKRLLFGNRVTIATDSSTLLSECRVSKDSTEFEFVRSKWSLSSLFANKKRPVFDTDESAFIVHQILADSVFSELPFETVLKCTIVFIDPNIKSVETHIKILPRQPRSRSSRVVYIHPWPFHYSVDLIKIFTLATYREQLLNAHVVKNYDMVVLDREEPLYHAYYQSFYVFREWVRKVDPTADVNVVVKDSQDLVYIHGNTFELFRKYIWDQAYRFMSYIDFNLSAVELSISERDKTITPESAETFLKLARTKLDDETLELKDAKLCMSLDVSARCLCSNKSNYDVEQLQQGNVIFGAVAAKFSFESTQLNVYQSSLFSSPQVNPQTDGNRDGKE